MPRQKPVVLEGTRGPRSDRIEDMRAQSEALPSFAVPDRPKVDGTVYMSHFPGYCVLVTAPADLIDPITGRKTIGRPTKAQFKDGRYVNNAKDPKVRAHIDEVLQGNTRFGRPGSGCDYWLAEDAIRMTLAAAKASAMTTLAKLRAENPDEFKSFVAKLTQGDATDVTMPAPPAAPGVNA